MGPDLGVDTAAWWSEGLFGNEKAFNGIL